MPLLAFTPTTSNISQPQPFNTLVAIYTFLPKYLFSASTLVLTWSFV